MHLTRAGRNHSASGSETQHWATALKLHGAADFASRASKCTVALLGGLLRSLRAVTLGPRKLLLHCHVIAFTTYTGIRAGMNGLRATNSGGRSLRAGPAPSLLVTLLKSGALATQFLVHGFVPLWLLLRAISIVLVMSPRQADSGSGAIGFASLAV